MRFCKLIISNFECKIPFENDKCATYRKLGIKKKKNLEND